MADTRRQRQKRRTETESLEGVNEKDNSGISTKVVQCLDDIYGSVIVKVNPKLLKKPLYVLRETNLTHSSIDVWKRKFSSGGYGDANRLISICLLHLAPDLQAELINLAKSSGNTDLHNLPSNVSSSIKEHIEKNGVFILDGLHRWVALCDDEVIYSMVQNGKQVRAYLYFRIDKLPMMEHDILYVGGYINSQEYLNITMSLGDRCHSATATLHSLLDLPKESWPIPKNPTKGQKYEMALLNLSSKKYRIDRTSFRVIMNVHNINSDITNEKQRSKYNKILFGVFRYSTTPERALQLEACVNQGTLNLWQHKDIWNKKSYEELLFTLLSLPQFFNATSKLTHKSRKLKPWSTPKRNSVSLIQENLTSALHFLTIFWEKLCSMILDKMNLEHEEVFKYLIISKNTLGAEKRTIYEMIVDIFFNQSPRAIVQSTARQKEKIIKDLLKNLRDSFPQRDQECLKTPRTSQSHALKTKVRGMQTDPTAERIRANNPESTNKIMQTESFENEAVIRKTVTYPDTLTTHIPETEALETCISRSNTQIESAPTDEHSRKSKLIMTPMSKSIVTVSQSGSCSSDQLQLSLGRKESDAADVTMDGSTVQDNALEKPVDSFTRSRENIGSCSEQEELYTQSMAGSEENEIPGTDLHLVSTTFKEQEVTNTALGDHSEPDNVSRAERENFNPLSEQDINNILKFDKILLPTTMEDGDAEEFHGIVSNEVTDKKNLLSSLEDESVVDNDILKSLSSKTGKELSRNATPKTTAEVQDQECQSVRDIGIQTSSMPNPITPVQSTSRNLQRPKVQKLRLVRRSRFSSKAQLDSSGEETENDTLTQKEIASKGDKAPEAVLNQRYQEGMKTIYQKCSEWQPQENEMGSYYSADPDGFRVTHESITHKCIAWNLPEPRLNGFTNIVEEDQIEEDSKYRNFPAWYLGDVQLIGSKNTTFRVFEDRERAYSFLDPQFILRGALSNRSKEHFVPEMSLMNTIKADSRHMESSSLDIQRVLRAYGFRPPHRSFFLKWSLSEVLSIRHFLFHSIVTTNTRKFDSLRNFCDKQDHEIENQQSDLMKTFLNNYFFSCRKQLDTAGFVVFSGILESTNVDDPRRWDTKQRLSGWNDFGEAVSLFFSFGRKNRQVRTASENTK